MFGFCLHKNNLLLESSLISICYRYVFCCLQSGRAEMSCDDTMTSLRKAARWAQMGLVVSTGPPADVTQTKDEHSAAKKVSADVICKDKNVELAR